LTLTVGICGVGLLGPGLPDWAASQALLRDPPSWLPMPTLVAAPARLPPTERRRAGNLIRASVLVADQACVMAGIDPATLTTVFTSSTGDPGNCHALCESLATPERLVSPTRFTNSVHNAVAGYWHIAVRSQAPSTSLAAYDASVDAGLLEATVQCLTQQQPVLLVACDLPYPEPLHALRPIADVFALALLLSPDATAAPLQLSLELGPDLPATSCDDARLERLRLSIPAARALPLLQAVARRDSRPLVLHGLSGMALHLTLRSAA
jgi:hypothetical protein